MSEHLIETLTLCRNYVQDKLDVMLGSECLIDADTLAPLLETLSFDMKEIVDETTALLTRIDDDITKLRTS